MKRILIKIVVVLMTPVWLAIAVGIFLGPPAELLWGTYNMLTMSATTTAVVRRSEVVVGDEGASRPVIGYAYRVGGKEYTSERYLPGFFGNWGEWSGGGAAARKYPVGRAVEIHYRPGDPAHSSLEFGWHKWAIGLTLAFWGTGLLVLVQRHFWPTGPAAGFSIPVPVLAGFLLIAVGPNVIRPAEAPWYGLGLVVGGAAWYGGLLVYGLVRRGA
jgi:hypothetical protein